MNPAMQAATDEVDKRRSWFMSCAAKVELAKKALAADLQEAKALLRAVTPEPARRMLGR